MKGVFTQLDQLIRQLVRDQIQGRYERFEEELSFNFFDSNAANQEQSFHELNADFLYYQLLINCLTRMKPETNEINALVVNCKKEYENNSSALKFVKQFEREYQAADALWWYTQPSFLYSLLNKAFRVKNIHLLVVFRFFIRDIQRQLTKRKCSNPIRVYRAQLMSKEEIEILKTRMNQFISINSFLSTSLQRELALFYLGDSSNSFDLERVFFKIDADPRLPNVKPFSEIASMSQFPFEEEVLFMAGSIFRLLDIRQDHKDIWNVRMVLCSDNNCHLQPLLKYLKDKLCNEKTTYLHLGDVLKDMGKIDDAYSYYMYYICQLPTYHPHSASCCHALGMIADMKGDLDSSLMWHNRSLKIARYTLKTNHPNVASIQVSLGEVHRKKGDYARALTSFEAALVIFTEVFGNDHPHIAACYNNVGIVYKNAKKYSKALTWYTKAARIREKHLPSNHHDLGQSYNNIGTIYRCLGQYDLALVYLKRSLTIKSKSLPARHSDLASTLANIGLVHEEKQDFHHALAYYVRANDILRHSLLPHHPNRRKIQRIIGRVRSKLR